MEVIHVRKITEYLVDIDNSEWGTYRRGLNGGWEVRMGESWEPLYNPEEEEKAFQNFISKENNDG